MTAAHVVNSADEVMIVLVDDSVYEGRVISTSAITDLALIQIDKPPTKLTYVELSDSDKVDIGEEVFVIGAPYGVAHTLSAGNLSGRHIDTSDDTLVDTEFLQTDAAINQGNSGGPLFTASGKLIGIVSHIRSQSGGSEGLGFVASSNMAKRVLLERTPFWLGVEYIPIRKNLAKALNVPYAEGLLVQKVAKNSLGERLGLRPGLIPAQLNNNKMLIGGDVIVEVGDDTVYLNRKGFQRITDYLNSVQAGELIKITVIREGKKMELTAERN